MENIKRKKVLVRGRYDDDGGRYLLTEEQIAILRKVQADGFLDEDIEIFDIDEEGPWEIVECCFDKSFTLYKTDEEIRKILGIPLDK